MAHFFCKACRTPHRPGFPIPPLRRGIEPAYKILCRRHASGCRTGKYVRRQYDFPPSAIPRSPSRSSCAARPPNFCHSQERKRRRISYVLRTDLLRTWDAPCGAPSFCSCRKTVKKEHAREKGFSQSRPSPWTLILRRLRSMRAIRMRVRDASLRSARAGPCGWKCR